MRLALSMTVTIPMPTAIALYHHHDQRERYILKNKISIRFAGALLACFLFACSDSNDNNQVIIEPPVPDVGELLGEAQPAQRLDPLALFRLVCGHVVRDAVDLA